MPKQVPPSEKPVWEVQVRPIGASHEPWETRSIRARSVLQAEAIMRRQGYEMATQTAMSIGAGKTGKMPGPERPAALKPLLCANCGYELAGLTIERASVTCTECSYSQPLVAWTDEQSRMIDRNHPVMGIFVIIGIIATILFLLLVSIPIIFAFV
ncbi:MAG: hypothetical protein ACF8MF_09035 [Phycisphaerales bacterium JB052]